MAMISIIKPDGSRFIFPSRVTKSAITKAEQSCALLGEDVVNIDISSASPIDFQIGSYLEVFGKTYTLNQLPSVKKTASNSYSYNLTFESEQYELLDCAWLLPDNTAGDSLTGKLADFVNVLITDNISRSRSDWRIGDVPDTETKTLTYTSQNCLQVLQNLCKEFEVEFEIVRDAQFRILNLKERVGKDFFKPFQYGRTGGAYSIERKTNNSQNVITKLYAFGSSDNLRADYGYNRLCLPYQGTGNKKNNSFIVNEKKVEIFGTRENVKIWDNIKPQRVGKVSRAVSLTEFSDTSMDFDLNERTDDGSTKWLIADTAAKVTFQSGNLAGYSFDIVSYNNASKTFRVKQFADENGLKFPNPDSPAFQISEGDKYIIEGIRVPDSYIQSAENELLSTAEKYYAEYCNPHVDYTISLNPLYLETLVSGAGSGAVANVFSVGDSVTIIDSDLGINEEDGKIRVNKFVRNVLDPYSYQLTLSNNVQVTTIQRVIGELMNIQQVIQMNNLTDAARAKRNWKTTQEVLNSVFDAEGDYYTDKIKPNSIETQMLAVGAKPQQFILKGGLIRANYGGNPNIVHIDSGTLEHYTINPDGTTRVWALTENEYSELEPSGVYYIYAKCAKSGDVGTLILTQQQIKVEDVESPDFYHFLIGVLSSVTDGSRFVSLTYGSSTINGRFITTGCIQSADGSCIFDIDNNRFIGPIEFTDGLIADVIAIGPDKDNIKAEIGWNESDGSILTLLSGGSSMARMKYTKLFANGRIWVKNGDKFTSTLFDADPNNQFVYAYNLEGLNYDMDGGNLSCVSVNATKSITAGGAISGASLNISGAITAGGLKSGNYQGKIPFILWTGLISVGSRGVSIAEDYAADYFDAEFPTTFSFSVNRISAGELYLTFKRNLGNYFCVANGKNRDSDSRGPIHVSIYNKTSSGMTIHLADSGYFKDGDFWLTIFGY